MDDERSRRYERVRPTLEALSDRQLGQLLADGRELGAGIGGRTWSVRVGGVPVFVKRIPVTALEARHVGDTSHWDSAAAVRRRLDELSGAEASALVFLEYVPQTLHEWLMDRFGEEAGAQALTFAEHELSGLIDHLRGHGIVHFDAHPGNVLCDGRRLYLGDLGLWLDPEFALSRAEADFLRLHRDWDGYDVSRYLVNWVCRRLAPGVERTAVIRDPAVLPGYAAGFVDRHGAVALVLNEFYDALVRGPTTVPYPAAELAAAGAAGQRSG